MVRHRVYRRRPCAHGLYVLRQRNQDAHLHAGARRTRLMLTVDWIDRGRSPRNPPNPLFPKGIDMDVTFGAARFCSTLLPYPAKRCGYFVVRCTLCKTSIVITTAGRAD